jgi:hypothetical protein
VNRRRLFALAAFVAPLIIVAAACSFPDVTFGPEAPDSSTATEGGGGGDGGGPTPDSAAIDATEAGLKEREGLIQSDGAIADVATRPEASPELDASVCSAKPVCDCDEDNFLKDGCDAGGQGGGKPAGDCNDLDGFRNPAQTFSDEKPKPPGNGDWNCDGTEEKGYVEGPSWCGGTTATGCTGGPGFDRVVGCGELADFYECKPNGLFCAQKWSGTQRKQACR